jgi:peroxiredoxin
VATKEGEMPGLILLSDRNADLVKTYGIKPYDIDGSLYSSRATFVIDKQGILRYVNYDYKVKEDYEPLMKVLSGLE